EDGIRDFHVTGVQTCALPISTGYVLLQPIDEFNRPSRTDYGAGRVPPPESDVERLFDGWNAWVPDARKYLTAARDYVAASLWRRSEERRVGKACRCRWARCQ